MSGTEHLVTVRFSVPVEGVDPSDGEVFLASRHRVAAVYARQDRSETLFVNDDGEVVARWATRLIERIDWPPDDIGKSSGADTTPSVGTLEWRKDVQERHPRAYQRWTEDEDAEVTEQFRAGCTVAQMSVMHERRPGGITARLVRLGLIDPETPEREIGRPGRTTPRPIDEPPTPAVTATVPPVAPRPAASVPVIEVMDDTCRRRPLSRST